MSPVKNPGPPEPSRMHESARAERQSSMRLQSSTMAERKLPERVAVVH